MNDERLMILQLLQEGKITKEEAEKLLEALNEGEKKILGEETKIKVSLSKNKDKENKEEIKDDEIVDRKKHKSILSELEDGLDIFSDYVNTKINKLTDEFSEEKLDTFNKKVNHNIDKIINDFTKGTEDITKGIFSKLDNIMDTSKLKSFKTSSGAFPYIREYIKTYDFKEINNIEVENYYGAIIINSVDRSDLSIKVRTKYNAEDELLFKDEIVGDLLKIQAFCVNNDAVDVELSLPKKVYDNLVLSSQGTIAITAIEAGDIRVCSTAADIKMDQVKGNYCYAKVHNGNITVRESKIDLSQQELMNGYADVDGLEGDRLVINNSNGRIGVSYGKIKDIEANNSNGRIFMNKCNCENIRLRTSNKKIAIDTCTGQNFDLVTSNDDIEIDLIKVGEGYDVNYFTSRGDIVRNSTLDLNVIEDITDYGVRRFKANSSSNILDKNKPVVISAKTSNGSIITNI